MNRWKNLLQELCHQTDSQMPIYNTNRTDGPDHDPIWEAKVQITIYTNTQIFSAIGTTKKSAELGAAEIAYRTSQTNINNLTKRKNIIRNQKVDNINNINFKYYDNIILVDAENCSIDMNNISDKTIVLCFVAKNTTRNNVFNLQQEYLYVYVFVSESVGKDAADHLLTFYAGKLSIIEPNKMYYILTKDHYGEFLEKFMDKCKFICSLEEIEVIEEIEEIEEIDEIY